MNFPAGAIIIELSQSGGRGPKGSQFLEGAGVPGPGVGANGDFYFDTTAHAIYGPKQAGAWGTGSALNGPPNTLTIGTVTKLPPGSTPTAILSGTSPSQVLSLGIVTGDEGDASPRFASVPLALAGTTDGQYSRVTGANGVVSNGYLRNSGSLDFIATTLTQGGIALGQKIALLAAPGAVTPLPAGALVSLDPVMAVITDDRYVPASMAATVTHNAHPGGAEEYTAVSGTVLTKNYATDSGIAVHRVQMSAHAQLFYLSAALTAGLIKGKFLMKSTPGAGNQTVTAGLYPDFMDTYAITEGAWTTVAFSRTTSTTNSVNIWNNADVFPVDVIFREDVQIYLDGESIPAAEPSRIGSALRRTDITHAGEITRGSGNSVVAPFIGRIPLSTRDDNGFTFNAATFLVAIREDVANAVASGCLFTPLTGGVTGYNSDAVVLGTQGGVLDIRARSLFLPGTVGSITGKGWVILAARMGPSGRSLHLDGIQLLEDTTPHTAFSSPYLNWGGAGYLDAQAFNGRVGVPVVYPTALSDAALTQACKNIRDRHILMGDAFQLRNMVVPEGDSITFASGLGGEYGYAYLNRDALGLKPWWRMTAASGSTLATMTTRLPLVLSMGRAAVSMGYRPILTMMIGANGLPTQTDLRAYWATVRAAGYRIIVQPPTYRTGGYTNGQCDTFRALLVSEFALGNFDAYSDIYQSSVIASQTFPSDSPGGNPNTLDGLHWTAAVHAIVAPYMQAAIASQMV